MVEVQYTNPQQYRAKPLEVAVEKLRNEYEARIQSLYDVLLALQSVDAEQSNESLDIRSIRSSVGIRRSVKSLIEAATSKIIYVENKRPVDFDVVDEILELAKSIDISVKLGARNPAIANLEGIQRIVPSEIFETNEVEHRLTIGAIMLVDRKVVLVCLSEPTGDTNTAILGRGNSNWLVILIRAFLTPRIA